MKKSIVWVDMARRKVLFHKNEEWDNIRQWGLFDAGEIKKQLDSGELISTMSLDCHTIWVYPSKDAWEKNIKPLIEKYSISELLDILMRG